MFDAINAVASRRAAKVEPAPAPPLPLSTHTVVVPRANEPTTPPAATIEEIAKKLPPGMMPAYDSGRIVHNSSHIVAKCGRRHIQKYFISDVERGLIRECTTCAGGTAFMRTVCVVAENLLEAPFVLEVDRYINPVLCVTLVPVKKPGDDYSKVDGDMKTIFIHKTTSSRRITNTIAENLLDHDQCVHLRSKLSRNLPPAPRFVEEPPDLPVISRDVSERLCIDST